MNKTIEHYRNPGGWIDFWVGLVVFTLFFSFFGYRIYQHELVRELDAKHNNKSKITKEMTNE